MFPLRFFRENLGFGEGGEEGRDNDVARETFERTGASVMGRRMFDLGERSWPPEAPFHTPVFVVTHGKRDSWERPGGTTFHFVTDGIEHALHDHAGAGAPRRRHPAVRRRGRVPDRATAGPRGALGAGDAPDVHRPATLAAHRVSGSG